MILRSQPAGICLGLGLLVPLLAAASGAFTLPDPALLHHGWWPRLAMAMLAGGSLALAGALMQQALQNPLATPTTLGAVSGAQFALLLATVAFPGVFVVGREWVALAGAGAATSVVVLVAWRARFAPLAVVLTGLVVDLYLGALGIVLLLMNQEHLYGMLIWGAGSLAQSGWDGVLFLLPRLLAAAALAALLVRPLGVLALGDEQARSLGLALHHVRLAAFAIAVFLAACVTSVAGTIGFVGLAAPLMVRLLGVRDFGAVAVWSALLGALLLAVIDLALQSFGRASPTIVTTGAMTAVLGGVLLIAILPRLSLAGTPRPPAVVSPPAGRRRPAWAPMLIVLGLVGALSLLSGHVADGWRGLDLAHAGAMLPWRLPRTMAAGSAGALLAMAGVAVQRLTRNPMASPELLGISGGVSLGLLGALFLLPGATAALLAGAGVVGALVGIGAVILLNQRNGFLPDRVLLTGVALTATAGGLQALLLAGGDPRGQQAIAWMSGSTYYVDLTSATAIFGVALVSLVVVPLFSRWLDLLTLGPAAASALGLGPTGSRLILLAIVATLTASATLFVGPLSFVGLLAPHLACAAGFVRARDQLLGAACMGCALMITADWIGRQALYPQEIPAGLVACLLGGTFFAYSALRRRFSP